MLSLLLKIFVFPLRWISRYIFIVIDVEQQPWRVIYTSFHFTSASADEMFDILDQKFKNRKVILASVTKPLFASAFSLEQDTMDSIKQREEKEM